MRWIDDALEQAKQYAALRLPTRLRFHAPTRASLDGRELLVFCGNDYLGLRFDPRLVQAAVEAAQRDGTGAGASRLVSGHTELHEEAEAALAELVARPAALLTSSGFAANSGTIAALAGADDVVFSDALNHASIVDGCRLSRARIAVYPHADVEALAREVARHRPFRRGWVITESVFSMDGDLAPLASLREICDREGLHLYVDEAHALGVLGPEGRGAVAEANLATEVLVGTMGKSLGAGGAFVAGSEALRLYLWNHCRSFVFSTGLAPPVVAAAAAAARVVREDTGLRQRLRDNLARLREGVAALGLPVPGHPHVPILPLVVGDNARALALSQALRAEGIFVQAIRPPTVPAGTARLRITVSSAHSPAEIDALLEALRRRL